jgi:hypothetical protein
MDHFSTLDNVVLGQIGGYGADTPSRPLIV